MSDVPLEYELKSRPQPDGLVAAMALFNGAMQVNGYWDEESAAFVGAPPPGESYRLLNLAAVTQENVAVAIAEVLKAAGLPEVGAKVLWYCKPWTVERVELKFEQDGEGPKCRCGAYLSYLNERDILMHNFIDLETAAALPVVDEAETDE